MLRVVVHVNFAAPEQQGHGLKNIENILKDVHGKAEMRLSVMERASECW